MKPIVPGRYETAFVIKNATIGKVIVLEPWCDTLYTDDEMCVIETAYLEDEKSLFNLKEKFKHYKYNTPKEDIVVEFDASKLGETHYNNFIKQLPLVLDTITEIGTYQFDIFTLTINSLKKRNMIKPFFKNVF